MRSSGNGIMVLMPKLLQASTGSGLTSILGCTAKAMFIVSECLCCYQGLSLAIFGTSTTTDDFAAFTSNKHDAYSPVSVSCTDEIEIESLV